MKDIFTFDGAPIYLREMIDDDITDRYLSWFSDEVVTVFLDAKNLTKEDTVEYLRRGRESETYYIYAIIAKDADIHIGNVKVGPINKGAQISDLVTVIGDRDYLGKGIGTSAIRIGNQIAFDRYAIRKVTGHIHADNIGSMKAYEKAGWVSEGRLIGHDLVEGKPRDVFLVSCFNDRFFDLVDGEYVPK